MGEKWSDADMATFLDCYQNYELLWNPKLELYRNQHARKAALQEIVKHLNKPNLTESDLKNKIKNIRTTYNRELAKVLKSKKSGTGPNDIYTPVLIWFKQADSFLRAVTGGRISTSNLGSQDVSQQSQESQDTLQEAHHPTDDETSESIADENDDAETSHKDTQSHSSTNNKPISTSTSSNTNARVVATTRLAKRKSIKRNINISDASNPSGLEKALAKLEDISNKSRITEDHFETFGKYIASQLRELPLQRALRIQQNFQNILTEERIQYLTYVEESQIHQHYESSSSRLSHVSSTPEGYMFPSPMGSPQDAVHSPVVPELTMSTDRDILSRAMDCINTITYDVTQQNSS